jgi:hypothetical protein
MYTPPSFEVSAYNCPHCNAYAQQTWYPIFAQISYIGTTRIEEVQLSYCSHCNKFAIWYLGKMVEPISSPAPLPNPDMPAEIQADFLEAREIVGKSPRGAAALLRLCIQKLCIHLGENGKEINTDIGRLVEKGLPVNIQRSLDYVRVVGNEAVHPGELDLKDNQETAITLFKLINIIVETMITQPNHIEDLYNSLPPGKLAGIEQRDKK